MPEVYQVTKTWVDWDGWPVSSATVIGTFSDELKAREFLYNETFEETAWLYGHAHKGHNQYWIHSHEVV